jgi:hypothetical protein
MPKYIILAALLIITSFSIPPNVESGKRETRGGILYKIRATRFNKKVREFEYLTPPPYQKFFDVKRMA